MAFRALIQKQQIDVTLLRRHSLTAGVDWRHAIRWSPDGLSGSPSAVEVDLAIHDIRDVAAFTQELHNLLS